MDYDSRVDTYEHIQNVQLLLGRLIRDLQWRSARHDQSKLISPEKECFDEVTPKLAGLTYGSDEYRATLKEMKPAIQHHYERNSHHPEHFKNGIRGMDLLDVIEMLCDWKAATLRHNDGNIRESIRINQERFGFSDELRDLLLNTLPLVDRPYWHCAGCGASGMEGNFCEMCGAGKYDYSPRVEGHLP